MQFPNPFNLDSLNGSNGFVLNGIAAGDQSGFSVSSAGDINGDGLDDLIIGANTANGGAGKSYVVFGSTAGFGASLNLSSLNGSNGFVLNGIDPSDQSGYSVSSAGDINGDGLDDLIIGAFGADLNGNSYVGESYVVFGSTAGFGASLNLSSLNGSNGFVLNGIDPSDQSGYSVSSAGDINGDGLDDLIIGAFGADLNGNSYVGESYVVFGSTAGFGASLNLSSLNGSNGFVFSGIDLGDFSGRSVSSAGDINGDGLDDLIIGASNADPNGTDSGESYVVFGSNAGFGASFSPFSLNGNNGFVLNGIDPSDGSGRSVSSAGDINGDGLDDLIIGATYADPNGNGVAGESYVVFGSNAGFGASFNLSDLNGSNGFVLNGIDPNDRSGFSVSSAGDINGDGIDDLIIGAYLADPNGTDSGESYVVFGSTAGFGASFNLSDLNGSNGFVLNGINAYDRSGTSVSGAGDINGDGLDDFIIGARSADPNGNSYAGESYVVFGDPLPSITVQKLVDANGDGIFNDLTEEGTPGGTATFKVIITNNTVEEVTIDSINDDIYNIAGSDLDNLVGTTIPGNASVEATFTGVISTNDNDSLSWMQVGGDIDGEAAGDNSGYSVSLSDDGNTVAIGAPFNAGNGSSSGHVRVYNLDGGTWTQVGSDIDGEAAVDFSGNSVSLSEDGTTVAIGAQNNDGNGNDSGHVRVYNLDGGTWTQVGSDIDGEAAVDFSGQSVSLSEDGTTVAIGAPLNDGNGNVSGHVRVYNLDGGSWTQVGADIDGEAADDLSGLSVSLSEDGTTVAIGAPFNDGNGSGSGHVRVYNLDGGSWTQVGDDIDGEVAFDQSGWSVSLSEDGTTVAIGARFNDGNGGNSSGHVRVYNLDGGTWTQVGSDIDGEAAEDRSGWSVSLSEDGTTVAIGAINNDGNGGNSGHVRVYNFNGGTWTQVGSDIDGEAASDRSGQSVSLSEDGTTVAIGAPLNDGNDSGSRSRLQS